VRKFILLLFFCGCVKDAGFSLLKDRAPKPHIFFVKAQIDTSFLDFKNPGNLTYLYCGNTNEFEVRTLMTFHYPDTQKPSLVFLFVKGATTSCSVNVHILKTKWHPNRVSWIQPDTGQNWSGGNFYETPILSFKIKDTVTKIEIPPDSFMKICDTIYHGIILIPKDTNLTYFPADSFYFLCIKDTDTIRCKPIYHTSIDTFKAELSNNLVKCGSHLTICTLKVNTDSLYLYPNLNQAIIYFDFKLLKGYKLTLRIKGKNSYSSYHSFDYDDTLIKIDITSVISEIKGDTLDKILIEPSKYRFSIGEIENPRIKLIMTESPDSL